MHTFVVDCSKREEIYSAAEKVGEQVHEHKAQPGGLGVRKGWKSAPELFHSQHASLEIAALLFLY